jgi:hypothetical protein
MPPYIYNQPPAALINILQNWVHKIKLSNLSSICLCTLAAYMHYSCRTQKKANADENETKHCNCCCCLSGMPGNPMRFCFTQQTQPQEHVCGPAEAERESVSSLLYYPACTCSWLLTPGRPDCTATQQLNSHQHANGQWPISNLGIISSVLSFENNNSMTCTVHVACCRSTARRFEHTPTDPASSCRYLCSSCLLTARASCSQLEMSDVTSSVPSRQLLRPDHPKEPYAVSGSIWKVQEE